MEPAEEWLVKAIKKTPNCGYKTPPAMKANLARFFKDHVMTKVPLKKPNGDEMPQTMRSIRAKKATDWVRLCSEYKVMGFPDEPSNPLQHESDSTTRIYYAEKGSDNMLEARKRCIDKVKAGIWDQQPWMKMWLQITKEDEQQQ